jgi:hypothetical protein
MGNLEEDLKMCPNQWEVIEDYLQNEDGVKISMEDFKWVRLRKVTVSVYARISLLSQQIYLHHILCPSPEGMFTDHENRNKLDNRRKNLRPLTIHQSNINRPYNRKKTSKYRGVSRWQCPINGKNYWYWRATLSVGNKHIYLGISTTEEGAAALYNNGAIIHHGSFAQLNTLNALKLKESKAA